MQYLNTQQRLDFFERPSEDCQSIDLESLHDFSDPSVREHHLQSLKLSNSDQRESKKYKVLDKLPEINITDKMDHDNVVS